MSEETIYDPKEVKQNQMNDGQNDETAPVGEKKKRGWWMAGAAAAGMAAGLGLGLSPKLVFPNNPEDGEEQPLDGEQPEDSEQVGGDGEELNEVETPHSSGHLTGHDMDVATGVDDSMSFNQAFAAARHEVGPGGLFVWHGNTYGTYYANEWNAMSPDDKAQYWADVSHSTSNLNSGDEPDLPPDQPLDDPDQLADNQVSDDSKENPVDEDKDGAENEGMDDPQPPTPPDENGDNANNDGNDGVNPMVDDHEMPDVPVDGLAGDGEDIPSVDAPEPLVLSEEDVIAEFDLDGNGLADVAIVDANDNDIADVIVDTTGDGNYDTLVIDPEVDDNGELVVAEENIVEIGGVEMEDDSGLALGEDEMETFDDLPEDDLLLDVSDEETVADNPDVDDFASLAPDPDVTIDNNMDMSDFA